MSSVDKKLMDNHARNFLISFSEMLQQNELVDVTLVADGHLFSAHRLVLSAFLPYFRQMFAQMPANQQAFGKNNCKLSVIIYSYPFVLQFD